MSNFRQTLFERGCYTEEDYKDYCLDNDLEYDETDDSKYYDWVARQEEWDFDDMLDNCKYSKYKNYSVLVEVVWEHGEAGLSMTKRFSTVSRMRFMLALAGRVRLTRLRELAIGLRLLQSTTMEETTIHFISLLLAENIDLKRMVMFLRETEKTLYHLTSMYGN